MVIVVVEVNDETPKAAHRRITTPLPPAPAEVPCQPMGLP